MNLPIVLCRSRMPNLFSTIWLLAQLREAAQGCRDRQVLNLIKQIPAEKAVLAETLAALAADYHFNDIFNLITVTAQP